MSQAQVDISKANISCASCFRHKAKWDTHTLCFKCRPCNQDNTCHICCHWDTDLWKKIHRATLEAARKAMTDMDTNGPITSEPDDFVQVSQAKQAATIKALQDQLDLIQAQEMKPKRKPSSRATATVTKPVPVPPTVHTADGMDPLNLNPSEDEFKDAISSSAEEGEHSTSSSDEADTHEVPEGTGPLTMSETNIFVMTNKGILAVPYTKDAGQLVIQFPDRLQLVAKLCDIQTIRTRQSSPMPDFGYGQGKRDDSEPSTHLLPLSQAVGKTVSAFITPLEKSSSSRYSVFNRPRKPSQLCVAPDEFSNSPIPARAFNRLTRMEVVPDLPASFNEPKLLVQQLTDVDKASRDALSAISFIHHTGQAIYQLSQFITHPRQDLQGIHACINSILDMQGSANKTVLQQTSYIQHWAALTKRDMYLEATHKDVTTSTKRALRCAPWTSGSLFGDKERELAEECEASAKAFNKQQPQAASQGSKRQGARPRQRDRKRGKQEPTARSASFKGQQLNITATTDAKKPFRPNRDPPSGSRRGGRDSRK